MEKRFDKKLVKIYHGDLSKNLFLNQISKKISYVHNLINNAASRNDDHLFEVKKRFGLFDKFKFQIYFLDDSNFFEKNDKKKRLKAQL